MATATKEKSFEEYIDVLKGDILYIHADTGLEVGTSLDTSLTFKDEEGKELYVAEQEVYVEQSKSFNTIESAFHVPNIIKDNKLDETKVKTLHGVLLVGEPAKRYDIKEVKYRPNIPFLKSSLWSKQTTLNYVANGHNEKTYAKGSSEREDIKLIQEALKKLGFNIGAFGANKDGIDGDYGSTTEDNIKLFQQKYSEDKTKKPPKGITNVSLTRSKPAKYSYILLLPLEVNGIVNRETLIAMDQALVSGWKYKEPEYKKAPWMPFALAELTKHKGLVEKDTLLNASIKKYHETTNAKKYFARHEPNYYEISWCASFVNWCFNQTKNYKNPNSGFCALAHDWAPENSLKVKNNKYADGWKQGEKSEAFYGAVVVLSYSHVAFLIGLNENATRYIYIGGNQGSNIDGQSKLTYGSVKVGNEYALMKPKSYIVTADEKKLPKLKLNAKGGTYETTH